MLDVNHVSGGRWAAHARGTSMAVLVACAMTAGGSSAAATPGSVVRGSVGLLAGSPSTISMSGTTLVIDGGPGSNDISMGGNSGLQRYIVDGAGVIAGPGCLQMEWNKVQCPADWTSPDYTAVLATLGDGADILAMGWVGVGHGATVDGGPGNDTIFGTGSDDVIAGGDGNDEITGNPGNDRVDGGAGDDRLLGGSDGDVVIGGPGRDDVNGDGPAVLDDGNDQLDLVDGELDQAQCGFGADIVQADPLDVVDSLTCEVINRPAAPAPAPAPAPVPAPAPAPVPAPAPAPAPVVPTASVVAKAVSGQGKLWLDIDPDQGKGYWTFQVQRLKKDGTTWATYKKSYKTRGSHETRTLNFKKGTYRVVVASKFGYQGVTSGGVNLRK